MDIPIWSTISLLIQAGADIYVANYYDVNSLKEIETPTTFAEGLGAGDEWREALQACGHDPEEVYKEDARHRWWLLRLHGAKRTAIDTKELDVPPAKGLRKRISRACYEITE